MHVAICDDDEMSRFFILKLLSGYASANKSINLSFSSFSGPEALLEKYSCKNKGMQYASVL